MGPTTLRPVFSSPLFIYSGFGKLMAPDTVATRLSDAGFPLAAVATYVTIAIEIGASIALIFGYRVLACCSLLAGFTLMTSLFFHQFWAVDAAQRTGQTINFLKNLSIIGGLWFVTRSTLETRSLARGIACSAEAAWAVRAGGAESSRPCMTRTGTSIALKSSGKSLAEKAAIQQY